MLHNKWVVLFNTVGGLKDPTIDYTNIYTNILSINKTLHLNL